MSRLPAVTTHALRRYGERMLGVKGLDDDDAVALFQLEERHAFDPVKAELTIKAIVRRGVIAGASWVTFLGLKFALEKHVVVTVKPQPGRYTRRRQGRVARDED